MRLWHQDLISKLPQKQLCGQWRECIALLGNGWGKKHSVVNYVFKHDNYDLVAFSYLVYDEMIKRGYSPNENCIKNALSKRHKVLVDEIIEAGKFIKDNRILIYPIEHNDEYYKDCIENLKKKGIEI